VASWVPQHSVRDSQPTKQTNLVHNRPFYTFNNDNILSVIQVKLWHGECLACVCQRSRYIPNISEDSRLKLWNICQREMLVNLCNFIYRNMFYMSPAEIDSKK